MSSERGRFLGADGGAVGNLNGACVRRQIASWSDSAGVTQVPTRWYKSCSVDGKLWSMSKPPTKDQRGAWFNRDVKLVRVREWTLARHSGHEETKLECHHWYKQCMWKT
mmetsp:Transcript_26751/g.67270  ORF Transcript_26751/g.67270 Transcript_26751/m.67270 type:complete len:109 (-) Transcript_26751:339-665(-)